MSGDEPQGLVGLRAYLTEVSGFLEGELDSLQELQGLAESTDEPADSELLERLSRMLEATLSMEGWLRELEASAAVLKAELDAQKKEHAQLTALYDVSQVINSTLDLEQVLDLAMDQIIEVTSAERGFLMLTDREVGSLTFKVARHMDRETIAGPSFEISRSIVERVAEEGVPLLTTNAQADPRFRDQSSVVGFNLRSILCVPLLVKDEVTGVVYVDNRIQTGRFAPRDRDLLVAFSNQAAVAIENARLFEDIRQRMNEIATMKNRMDNIFGSMASGVLTTDNAGTVTTLNRAAEGILGQSGDEAIGKHYRDVLAFPDDAALTGLIEQAIDGQVQLVGQELECDLARRGRITLSLSVSPLRDADNQTLGSAVVIDDLTEKRRLEEERSREERERKRTRGVLERYVHPTVVERLLSNPEELRLGGTKQELTVLFADIEAFSSFAEKVAPEILVRTLNDYLGLAAEAVLSQGGMLDKFLGDAVMGIFNWPESQEDHCLRAVRAALTITERASSLEVNPEMGSLLSFKVGINVGEAVVGNVGIPQRSDYTAIGDSVNLAKRLQEHAQPGQILLSHAAYEMTRDDVDAVPLEPIRVKGRSGVEQVYELRGLMGE